MNRETKLALLLGFCAIVVVGVLVGEHFSKGRNDRPETVGLGTSAAVTPTRTGLSDPIAGVMPGSYTEMVRPVELTMDPAAADTREPVGRPTRVATAEPREDLADSNASGMIRPNRDTFLPPPAANSTDLYRMTSDVPGTAPVNTTPRTVVDTTPRLPVSTGVERMHPVQKGETLATLAGKYYADKKLSADLAAYNAKRLSPDGTVRTGVTLRIPPKDVLLGKATLAGANAGQVERPAAVATRPTTLRPETPRVELPRGEMMREPAPVAPGKPETGVAAYVVKKGDTFGTIAQATLGTSKRWKEIAKANPGVDSSNLKIGQKLKIPAK